MSATGNGGAGGPRSHASPPRGFFGSVPAVVLVLAGALAAIFMAMEVAPASLADRLSGEYGFSPERLVAGFRDPAKAGAATTLVTHALLHASIPHLLFNLLWLVVFGTPTARRLGSLRFILYFFAGAAAGALFFAVFHLGDATLLIGASGGISGLLGGLVRFAFHRPDSRPTAALGVLPLGDRSVIAWATVVVLMNASVAVFGPGVGAGDADIAWQAHVGGFLFGLVAFPLFDPRRH
jgi:membrane associated rhomboid family serine protease